MVFRRPSLTALLAVGILSGCVTANFIEDTSALSPGISVVFGNVQVFFENAAQKWNRYFIGSTNFWLLVMPEGAQEASSYRLDDTSEFRWSLAPGKYNLVGYVLRHFSRQYPRRTWGAFTVPANASAVYIGDISIALYGDTVAVRVTDNGGPATAKLRSRFPKLEAAPVKSLLRISADGGSNRRAESPCKSIWGVRCNEDFVGVRPLTATTAGVSWSASGNPNVTYDLAVYEMVRFMYGGLFGPVKMPGRRVVYRENLSRANYTFDDSLNPEATYYWSVRLRHGDQVSKWSRHKIASNPIIARWTRTNPWFSFGARAGRY